MSTHGTAPEAPHWRFDVGGERDVELLRQSVILMAARCSSSYASDLAVVASELAMALLRQGEPGGYLLARETAPGVELLAVAHVPRGGTTTKPLGDALTEPGYTEAEGVRDALQRVEGAATAFDVYSDRDGAVVLARLGTRPPRNDRFRWGAVSVPAGGSGESGDAWAVTSDGGIVAVVVDGLGHGPEAAMASRAAVSAFVSGTETAPEELVAYVHAAMRQTRGGVLGACWIDATSSQLTYVGIGNVTGRLVSGGESRGLLGREGMIGTGLRAPSIRAVTYPWEPGATVVIASDGLKSRWDPLAHPGLLSHDPAVVAAVLERDHRRQSDDTAVLVVQDLRPGGGIRGER